MHCPIFCLVGCSAAHSTALTILGTGCKLQSVKKMLGEKLQTLGEPKNDSPKSLTETQDLIADGLGWKVLETYQLHILIDQLSIRRSKTLCTRGRHPAHQVGLGHPPKLTSKSAKTTTDLASAKSIERVAGWSDKSVVEDVRRWFALELESLQTIARLKVLQPASKPGEPTTGLDVVHYPAGNFGDSLTQIGVEVAVLVIGCFLITNTNGLDGTKYDKEHSSRRHPEAQHLCCGRAVFLKQSGCRARVANVCLSMA